MSTQLYTFWHRFVQNGSFFLLLGGTTLVIGNLFSAITTLPIGICHICTKGTLRHILGLTVVILEMSHFMSLSGLFECFSENHSFLDNGAFTLG